MQKIPLTQGKVALIDDADLPKVVGRKWYYRRDPKRRTGYALSKVGRSTTLLMHRIIADAPPGVEVDHVDGDGLNNRRYNLRLASTSLNQANQAPPRVQKTSAYKGVSWSTRDRVWRAGLGFRGKKLCLGHFRNELAAALAYDAAALEHFGEFARLNFPAVLEAKRPGGTGTPARA